MSKRSRTKDTFTSNKAAKTSGEYPFYFENTPLDILKEISSYLDAESLKSFANVNQFLHSKFYQKAEKMVEENEMLVESEIMKDLKDSKRQSFPVEAMTELFKILLSRCVGLYLHKDNFEDIQIRKDNLDTIFEHLRRDADQSQGPRRGSPYELKIFSLFNPISNEAFLEELCKKYMLLANKSSYGVYNSNLVRYFSRWENCYYVNFYAFYLFISKINK
jgi:hypothetical protein